MKIPRFGKILTFIVSGLAMLGALIAIVIFSLNDLRLAKLKLDDVRYYEGKYYSEDALVYETGPLRRGDPLNYAEVPIKENDAEGNMYTFIGWDLDGNNIPDVLGDRIYFNFKANACFSKIKLPDDFSISDEQLEFLLNLVQNLKISLTPEQVQQLIDFLMRLNIDWSDIDQDLLMRILDFLNMDLEELLQYLNLDLSQLLSLLNAPVLSYTASDYSFPVFFRSQSYGNYNKSSWAKGDYYKASNVSEGSVNPLCFAADKISKTMNIQYDITYLKKGKFYPVPAYEFQNQQGLDSESHSLTNPAPRPSEEYPDAKGYTTSGLGFYPASAYTVLSLKEMTTFSSSMIEQDELKYRSYAREHYLKVDDKYKELFTRIAEENDIHYDDEYLFTSAINKYFKDYTLYELNTEEMKSYPKGVDKVEYFINEAKAGLSEHFATATTLFYRSLGVPARYVEGYFDYVTDPTDVPRVVGGLQAHAWTEIYIDGVGWMMADTSICKELPPEYSKYIFGAPGVSFDTHEKLTLDHIEVEVSKNHYFTTEQFDKEDMQIEAYYTNGTHQHVLLDLEHSEDKSFKSLTIHVPSFATEGTKTIKTIYIENGIPAVAKTNIEVTEPTVISMKVVADSYQSNYLPGNTLNLNNIRFQLFFDDGNDETYAYYDDVTFPDNMSTANLGDYTHTVSLNMKPEITATFGIHVISEPVAPLASIQNLSTKTYTVIQNGKFDVLTLNIQATYEDGTYRPVDSETGEFRVDGDFSKVGRTTATLYYTERGVTKSTQITINVKNIAENIVFNIQQTKVYDGEEFDFTNAVTIENLDNSQESVLGEDERLETVFYYTNFDGEQFVDAGSYTFFVKFKIVNENGTNLTEDYLGTAEKITIHPSEFEEPVELEFGTDDFKVGDDGYVDLSGLQFTIEEREMTLTTSNMQYDTANGIYYDQYGSQITDFSPFVSTTNLAPTDTIDYGSLVFNTNFGTATVIDNSLDMNAFAIISTTRDGVNVTSNYIIHTTWGDMTKI